MARQQGNDDHSLLGWRSSKAASFPLVAKDSLPEIAEPIFREIKKHFPAQYDAKQSIGKRYARMDEADAPFCFTIDGQSKEDGTVTVRNRDDASQSRLDRTRCLEYLRDQLKLWRAAAEQSPTLWIVVVSADVPRANIAHGHPEGPS